MNNKYNILPSKRGLVKSTIIAISVAAFLLVTVILPAEYGIDPTGIGSLTGLKKMGEIKVSLAKESIADQTGIEKQKPAVNTALIQESEITEPVRDKNVKNDLITITLKPDEGKEIKVAMDKGKVLSYSWWTDKNRVNFDTHADSEQLKIKYHQYGKGTTNIDEGKLEAAFNGKHGWFWRNRSTETLTVTLKISGEYTSVN